jgi:hypothetical protein
LQYPHFDPTSIFAGDFQLASRKITIAQGQNAAGAPLKPGTLLGLQTNASPSYAAKGGNTGNATLAFGSPPTLANVQPGVYKVVFSSATAFTVFDPKGDDIGTGVNGTAFSNEIAFTTTAGGTAMVAGDTLLVTIAQPTYTSASAAGADNVGNGTIALGSPAYLPYAQPGVYGISFVSASNFNVTDPFGNPVGAGIVGTAFDEQIGFTISAGSTPFAFGDTFSVTLTAQTMYEISVATASDGSQIPGCILADWADTSSAPAVAGAYFTGQFSFEALTVDPSWTFETLNQAFAAKGRSLFTYHAGAAA